MNPNFIHYFTLKSELNELFASISLRAFAKTIINIFVPIYLINLGFSIKIALIFFAVLSFSHAIGVIITYFLSKKLGFKHIIMISSLLLIGYYYFLSTIDWVWEFKIYLYLIAVLGGFANGLFFTSFHSDFARSVSKKKSGKMTGYTKMLISFAKALGPLVGVYLLIKFGFDYTFLIVCGIMFLSIIPLFFRKDKRDKEQFSFKDMKGIFNKKILFAHLGRGMEQSINDVVWPIFIFYFILERGINLLGWITSLTLIVSLIVTYLFSKRIDKSYFLYKVSVFLKSFVWIVRSFVSTILGVFVIDSIGSLSTTCSHIGFNKMDYNNAKKNKVMPYIVLRETFLNATMGITLFLVSFSNNFYVMFGVAFVGSLMYLFQKN